MHIHSNIKYLRKRNGWTQQQLAKKLDKAYITIGDYERGRSQPPLSLILQLCEIFGVDLETLVRVDIKKEGLQNKGKQQEQSLLKQYQSLQEKYHTLHRLSELQEHRLAELEREIWQQAPDLARKLGLKKRKG